MDYTYREYEGILKCLTDCGYKFKSYGADSYCEREVILRHDVDISLDKAVSLAELENSYGENIKSWSQNRTSF